MDQLRRRHHPIVTTTPHPRRTNGPDQPPTPAARIAALAALMLNTHLPLAVGRTRRTATPPSAAPWPNATAAA